MNLSESLIEEIRRQVYLIADDDDVEGMRDSVRQMLRVTVEQRAAGLSESELRSIFRASIWSDVRRFGTDPCSFTAETILAVGTRMMEACLKTTQELSLSL